MSHSTLTSSEIATYQSDGLVMVEQAVSQDWIEPLLAFADEQLNNPSALVNDVNAGADENRLFTDRYLQSNGLVNRERSQIDRRRVIVTLTDAGRERLVQAPKPLQDSFVDRFSRLDNWEQHQIVAALERVATMMDAEQLDAAPLLATGETVI